MQRFLLEVSDIKSLDVAACSLSSRKITDYKNYFLSGKPFPYLHHEAEFYYSKFYVNENVLIPRPETEFLVDLIVNKHKNQITKVLDVGTGSGVILLSLLKHHVGHVGLGVDISEDALEVARVNARRLNVNATFAKSDRLKNVGGTFDLIVSNPPYIKPHSHKSLVHASVDKYEPHEALYISDDEYDLWFEEFFKSVKAHLKGHFYMEGHELELDQQAKILNTLGFKNVEVINDMSNCKRFLHAFI